VSVQVARRDPRVVGESGSGKTTLARLFLRLERPTAGAILFDGQDVQAFGRDDLARYRRAVQAVFQDPYSSLDPRMRVADISPAAAARFARRRDPRASRSSTSSGSRRKRRLITSSAAASASGSPSRAPW
jgi:ABC-type glutathione transport system ATPase component